jgi:hypothetical protein
MSRRVWAINSNAAQPAVQDDRNVPQFCHCLEALYRYHLGFKRSKRVTCALLQNLAITFLLQTILHSLIAQVLGNLYIFI